LNAYNESADLIEQIESYRSRFGCYPQSVHADKIYRTRDNRKFCKKHGIRLSGPPLGRPLASAEKQQEIKEQTRQDEIDRIPIEGKFGQGKRPFNLGRIMSKLDITSEAAILVAFVVMNLEKWLKGRFFVPFFTFMAAVCASIRSILPSEVRSAAIWCRSGYVFIVFNHI
jgi:hypothetical protein